VRIFVTGGTGLIGKNLVRQLLSDGHECVVLTRDPQRARARLPEAAQLVVGDAVARGPWMQEVSRSQAVIHLAGAGIFEKRWTAAFKEQIRASRVESARRLAEAIRQAQNRPQVHLQASAVGYYGPRGDEELEENGSPGSDFLARVAVEWEGAAQEIAQLGPRVVLVRFGVVLAPDEGALPQLVRPFRLWVGGPVGSGRQWVSWIHIADLVEILRWLLGREDAQGVFNGTAPHPCTNREMARTIGQILRRPSFFRTPTWVLRLALGEVADVVCTGQRVIPKRLLDMGYSYRFPTIEAALRDLLCRS
jgi:uncharacterized protein (TIGR01777 family)